MRNWRWAAAAAVVAMANGAASAAVLTLASVQADGPGGFTFAYDSTLGPDEGLLTGDRFVIFDFAGYIDGSISSTNPSLIASIELTSPTAMVAPGFTDDAGIANLVFTYTKPDFRAKGGPFESVALTGFSARSIFGGVAADAFFSRTTKNNPDRGPSGAGTGVFMMGTVAVPGASQPTDGIPEPATWALMIGGFGMLGAAARRRVRNAIRYA